jgi:hypothetical protein
MVFAIATGALFDGSAQSIAWLLCGGTALAVGAALSAAKWHRTSPAEA